MVRVVQVVQVIRRRMGCVRQRERPERLTRAVAGRDAGDSDQSKAAVIEGMIVPVSNKMLVEKRNCDLG